MENLYVSSTGDVRTIVVTSNVPWEIQYATSSMYQAVRNGNTITIKVNQNLTSQQRTDFFNVIAEGVSKKVSITQYAATTTANTSTSTRRSKYNPFKDYLQMNDNFELFSYSATVKLGSGIGVEVGTMAMRWYWFQLQPLDMALNYNFVSGDFSIYYQPTVRVYLPWDSDWAVNVAAGPSLGYSTTGRNIWFMSEVGVSWHFDLDYNTMFFLRYDAAGWTVGASFYKRLL